MNDFKKKFDLQEFSSVCILFKTTILLLTLVLLLFAVPVSAEVYICDNFDAQDDWHPTVCDSKDPERIPPDPWSYVLCDTNLYIDSTAAHGGSGKGFGINWAQSMNEVGLHAPSSVFSGKTEVWVGFWFRHNSEWNWGGDTTYKWFRFGAEGDTINLNYDKNHRCIIGDTLLQSNIPFIPSDGNWHAVIIYLKHNSKGNHDGQLRLWWDGVEAEWTVQYGSMSGNTTVCFNDGYSTWPSINLTWGYQSRPDWGHENKSYFDDIIIASTKEEVENFLGAGGSPEPSNSAPSANAGDDQTLTDTDGNGSELVNIDGTGSYDEDGSISSYQWKEGSTVLSTEPKPQLNLGVGIHTITLVVTDNEGAEGSDSVTISIQEPGASTPYGTVLMQEFFNDSALADRGWYDAGATNQKVVYDAERQSNILEIVYQKGATIPEGGAMRHLFDETDTLYFKYHIKYSENWSWTGVDYGPHEFYFLTNAEEHDWKGPAYSRLTFYVEMVNGSPTTGIQDGMNVDTNNINEDLTTITENRAAAGCNGNTDGYSTICYESGGNWYNGKKLRPEISAIDNNRWYEVSVFVKLNSIVGGRGASDGQLKYWLDGQLLLSLDNILFRTGAQPDLKFKQLLFAPYFHNGVPQEQKFWIDEIVIGTDAGGTDVPSSPSGLTVVN